ncbi:uncharacterized protein LOC128854851 isoform X1 [Anastrepha ludens]|uniref:uncharacterized protein LOC128854851 isoform X1 n=1 Tax=Anastrepha ludens TaxID=28586 RepID=UPI0023AF5E06|nr:uncharacterized protein LOC128854851 isoform X1 [Anastrepha ludens]XP_053945253.1 uncharacterized protein LOC128854851 isoform X1 [Anastrepha ludens]
MRAQIQYSYQKKQLPGFFPMLLSLMLIGYSSAQRVAPGVPPQHYQQVPVQHAQQPQYQQQQQQVHHAPNVPPQNYQQQAQYQQVPVQQQPQYQQQQQPVQQPIQQQQQPQFQQPPQPVQQQHPPHQAHHGQQQVLNAANMEHERAHIQEHMQVPIDTSKMSEAELQFHYFKMHDSDNNNKLDGCELIKSLIHWHVQGVHNKQHGKQHDKQHEQGQETHDDAKEDAGKVYSDESLSNMIDYVLKQMDLNNDGYVDYTEYRKSEEATRTKT